MSAGFAARFFGAVVLAPLAAALGAIILYVAPALLMGASADRVFVPAAFLFIVFGAPFSWLFAMLSQPLLLLAWVTADRWHPLMHIGVTIALGAAAYPLGLPLVLDWQASTDGQGLTVSANWWSVGSIWYGAAAGLGVGALWVLLLKPQIAAHE